MKTKLLKEIEAAEKNLQAMRDELERSEFAFPDKGYCIWNDGDVSNNSTSDSLLARGGRLLPTQELAEEVKKRQDLMFLLIHLREQYDEGEVDWGDEGSKYYVEYSYNRNRWEWEDMIRYQAATGIHFNAMPKEVLAILTERFPEDPDY